MTDPVSLVYDADGRIYAAEMRGYPYPEKSPTGNVRRLEDRDGDGVFERSTIFVDGLSWPTSVLAHDGGVFIAVAPGHPVRPRHRRRRRGRREEGRLHRLRDPERPGARERPPVGPRRLDLRHLGGQRRRHPQPGAAGRQARLGPGPRLPVQARRLALRGDLGRRAIRPRLRRLGTPLHLQQQQPHPPDPPPRPLPGAEPGARGPGGAHRHRGRRVRRAGLPDQPGRAVADRPDPPARGRSRVCQAAPADRAGRHRLLHLRHRRDDLSRDRLRPRVPRQRLHRRRGGQPRPSQDPRRRTARSSSRRGPTRRSNS